MVCCCDSSDPNCLACSRAKYIQALINYSRTVQMPYSCPDPCCVPAPCCPPSPCCSPCPCPPQMVCCPPPCQPPSPPSPCPPVICPPCESWWRKFVRALLKLIADILWLLQLIIMLVIRVIENLYNFYYAFREANIFLQIAFVISLTAFITSMVINYRYNTPLVCPPPIIIEKCPTQLPTTSKAISR